MAATHISGRTIHSRSGIGVKTRLDAHDLKTLFKRSYLHKNISKTKVLIIDEISMLSADTFDLIEQIVRYFINRTKPFGGIQVVVCGDFFQLPPVVKYGSQTPKLFARQSDAREKMDFSVCYLSEQYRQSDTTFLDILNQIRSNTINEQGIAALRKRFNAKLEGKVPATKLYTHNIDVDRINEAELEKINEDEHTFYRLTKGKKAAVQILEKSILAISELKLKK
ncbi:AAA family ATPase [Patescibacteria group bacterium]|nr:AAA family ATPase [Patescibacteria group bacterium]MBU1758664.1 AAA family ATPase [Patescibacteria group bacterium]